MLKGRCSAVHGPIRFNLELIPYFIVVLVTCKNEDDSIKGNFLRLPIVSLRDPRGVANLESMSMLGRIYVRYH